jgi:SAM-dependent methyltransferase
MPESYIIRGGVEGRERLRVLARPLAPTTDALLARAGLEPGMTCLDAGCGGGDVTLRIAERCHPGRVLGIDVDETKLRMAREEAAGRDTIEYRRHDITAGGLEAEFDFAYTRFVLTHLTDPDAACAELFRALRPGGRIAVEDIEYRGCFAYPRSAAYDRYCELFTATARERGADPDIGPRLPDLLEAAGFADVSVAVVQPIGRRSEGIEGDAKLASALTMENIADAVIAGGHAAGAEVEQVVDELFRLGADDRTTMSYPRIFQAWATRPG